MKEESLQTQYGVWKMQLKDSGEFRILDHKRRTVHSSNCHMSTGVHLAMQLAKFPPLPDEVPPEPEEKVEKSQ